MSLELAKAFVAVRGDVSKFPGDIRAAQPGIQDALGQLAGSISGAMTALTGAAGMGGIISSLMKAGQFEQTKIAFEVMIGSAQETMWTLEQLTEFAAKTPFEMPEILQAARGLIQFGERGKDLMDTLNFLGNAASGTSTDFGMVALIFNQIRGVGKLLTQDFRQLSTRGILSLQDIADYYKVTTTAAQDMLSKGKISFEDLRKIMIRLSGTGGRFANLMEKQSRSLLGMWSTFKDSVNLVGRAIGEALIERAKAFVSTAIVVAEAVRGWVSEHKQLVGVVIMSFGAFSSLVTVLGLVKTIMPLVGVAFRAAFLSNPVGWVIIALGLAVAGIVKLIGWLQTYQKFQYAWARSLENLTIAWDRVKAAAGFFFTYAWYGFRQLMVMLGFSQKNINEWGDSFVEVMSNMLVAVTNFAVDASEWFLAIALNWGKITQNMPSVLQVGLVYMAESVFWFIDSMVKAGIHIVEVFIRLFLDISRLIGTMGTSAIKAFWAGVQGNNPIDVFMRSVQNDLAKMPLSISGTVTGLPNFLESFAPSEAVKGMVDASLSGVRDGIRKTKEELERGRLDILAPKQEKKGTGFASKKKPGDQTGKPFDMGKDTSLGFVDFGKKIQEALLRTAGGPDKQDTMIEIGRMGLSKQDELIKAIQQNQPAAVLK